MGTSKDPWATKSPPLHNITCEMKTIFCGIEKRSQSWPKGMTRKGPYSTVASQKQRRRGKRGRERDKESCRSDSDQLFSVSLSLSRFLWNQVSAEAPLESLIAAHGVGLSFLWFLTFRRSISLMQSCRALASIKSNIYQKIKREKEKERELCHKEGKTSIKQ